MAVKLEHVIVDHLVFITGEGQKCLVIYQVVPIAQKTGLPDKYEKP